MELKFLALKAKLWYDLTKYFSTEPLKCLMEQGRSNALANVMRTAYEQAVSGDVPAMTMYYLKTRAGWKETHVVEHSGGVKLDGKTKEEKLAEAKRLLSIIEEDDE